MAILPICIVGDPVLHNPTEIVTLDADGKPPADVVALLDDMYETMDAANGVGLAAKVTGVDRNGEPVELESEGFFARMLQHEVGHLDGFLYVDVLLGRNARAAKKAIKRSNWGVPGLSWMPGEEADPFGHDDEDDDN